MARATSRSSKANAADSQGILDLVSSMTHETLAENFAKTSSQFSTQLAALAAVAQSRLQTALDLEQAISLREDRLATLFSIEKEAMQIDEIRKQRDEATEEFELEKTKHAQELAELLAEHKKTTDRQTADAQFDHETRMSRFEAEFAGRVREAERSERIRQEDLNRGWAQREAALAEQESDYSAALAQAATFDDRLAAAIESATAAITKQMTERNDQAMAMLRRDSESGKALLAQQLEAAQSNLAASEARAADLRAQAEQARTASLDVVQTALNATSGREALRELQNTAAASKSARG